MANAAGGTTTLSFLFDGTNYLGSLTYRSSAPSVTLDNSAASSDCGSSPCTLSFTPNTTSNIVYVILGANGNGPSTDACTIGGEFDDPYRYS